MSGVPIFSGRTGHSPGQATPAAVIAREPPASPPPPAPAEIPVPGVLQPYLLRGKREVFTVTLNITPVIARYLLAQNPDNRRVSKIEVPRLMRVLELGLWRHNGDTIKIAKTGELNDGQNRLTACIETGIAFESEVTFGLERETRLTVDTGVTRTLIHLMHMQGLRYGTPDRARAAALALTFDKHGHFHITKQGRPTPDEVLEWLDKHGAELDVDLRQAGNLYTALGPGHISRGGMAAIFHHLRRADPTATAVFVQRLHDGNWPGKTRLDPTARLREWLQNRATGRGIEAIEEVAALVVIAFNAFRRGEGGSQVRLNWYASEKFPEIAA